MKEENDNQTFQPRGEFSLTAGKKNNKSRNKLITVIVAGAVVAITLIGLVFFMAYRAIASEDKSHGIDETKVKPDAALASTKPADQEIIKLKQRLIKQEQENRPQQPQPQQTQKAAAAEPEVITQTDPKEPPASWLRKMGGGVKAITSQGNQGGSGDTQDSGDSDDLVQIKKNASQPHMVDAGDNESASFGSDSSSRGSLSNLSGASYAASQAYMSPPQKFLLKRKTNIRCSLYTGIKTDQPGFVKCILIQPLYSADGSVVLAEKGSELNGEQRVEMKSGQTNLFTAFQSMDMSNGVRADLSGLGTEMTGESGIKAYVDNHWGQRIGGAVMLAFFEDALQAGVNSTQKSSSMSFNNSESAASSLAGKVLDSTINIAQSGYVPRGSVINVVVAQDIDFSSVFKTK